VLSASPSRPEATLRRVQREGGPRQAVGAALARRTPPLCSANRALDEPREGEVWTGGAGLRACRSRSPIVLVHAGIAPRGMWDGSSTGSTSVEPLPCAAARAAARTLLPHLHRRTRWPFIGHGFAIHPHWVRPPHPASAYRPTRMREDAAMAEHEISPEAVGVAVPAVHGVAVHRPLPAPTAACCGPRCCSGRGMCFRRSATTRAIRPTTWSPTRARGGLRRGCRRPGPTECSRGCGPAAWSHRF
jgi:hypothetical protein